LKARTASPRPERVQRAGLPDHRIEGGALLYFIIKNHPFSDGNKRIGAFLFVEFLHRNGRLIRNGGAVINDVGLAALSLRVSESRPAEKEVMIRLVMNVLAEPE
jgi:prophage maintenance system killer protein